MAALSVSSMRLSSMRVVKCCVSDKNDKIPTTVSTGREKKIQPAMRRKIFTPIEPFTTWEKEEITGFLMPGELTPEEAAKKKKAEYNLHMKNLCRGGKLKEAYDLLKEDTPDTETYGYLILGHFRKGEIEEAMDLLRRIKSIPGCEPDARIYGALVKGFCNKELPEKGVQMMEEMIQRGLRPTPKSVVVLVYALCKAGYYSSATDLVHVTLQPTLSYYKVLINALEKAGELGIAKDVLKLMRERGVPGCEPDAVKGLSRKELLKRLFKALKKVGALGKSGELDIENAGELDIEKAGELDIAKDILKLMQERKGKGLHPDFKSLNKSSIPRKERQGKGKQLKKPTPEEAAKKSKANYNFAVKYWCSSGNLKKAYDYLKLDDPDRTTYSYLILGHFYKREIEEAMDLFCKTKSIPGCEPDAVTYGAVVKGFCHNEFAEKGLQMTREMIQSGLTPTPKTILVLVNALCKAGYYSSATDLVHVTLQPSLLYYNFLIRALEKAGEPGIAKDILNLMQERGVDPDFTSYTGVVMSFVGKGLYFEAGRVAEEMKAKGIDNIKQMKEIQDGDGDGDGKQEALAVQ